jgi:fatty acid desaturase
MFKLKQHVISTSHKTKRAVRISLMLPLMCSNHGYLNNHHKHSKDDDDDDDDDNNNTVKNHNYNTNSNKKLQIFKLKEKYV